MTWALLIELARPVSICRIDGCDNRVKARKLCNPHYLKWRKYGDPLIVVRVPKPDSCSIDGCGKPVEARGWCKAHYSQWWKQGDPLYRERFPQPEFCGVETCDRAAHASGYCLKHYKRWRRWGDPLGTRSSQPEICIYETCNRSAKGGARGYCKMHYSRWLQHGDPSVVKKGGGAKKRAPRVTPLMLTCTICGETKPSKAFRKDESKVSLKMSACAECDDRRKAEYRDTHRDVLNERARVFGNRRRAIKLATATVDFTVEQLEQRVAYYGGKCWICKVKPYEHIDHVKPLSRGGSHLLCNLRPACATCNNRKRAKWPFHPSMILEEAA